MSPPTVSPRLTRRRKRVVENDEFGAFARRILRAYSRRVARGDLEALGALYGLRMELESLIDQAVKGLREQNYSWAQLGGQLGMRKQSAHDRWGKP